MTLRALFGFPLAWSAPVYYIYTDEAGTSAREPVTVVVAVIIHADTHWVSAQKQLQIALDEFVPASLRPGFIFHAKDVWSGYREHNKSWSRADRTTLIGAVASIPRRLRTAIAIGRIRRDSPAPIDPKIMMASDFHHIMAFHGCMARANKYVRDWASPNEVATVVAEDVPGKRKFLKAILRAPILDLPMTQEYVRPTKAEAETGKITQTNSGQIDKIIDTVHFVEKDEAPLLQIADACAFSFRRYFSNQDQGAELVRSMLDRNLVWDDWQGPASFMTFSYNPAHRYPTTQPSSPLWRTLA
jgi:hypothetical protein